MAIENTAQHQDIHLSSLSLPEASRTGITRTYSSLNIPQPEIMAVLPAGVAERLNQAGCGVGIKISGITGKEVDVVVEDRYNAPVTRQHIAGSNQPQLIDTRSRECNSTMPDGRPAYGGFVSSPDYPTAGRRPFLAPRGNDAIMDLNLRTSPEPTPAPQVVFTPGIKPTETKPASTPVAAAPANPETKPATGATATAPNSNPEKNGEPRCVDVDPKNGVDDTVVVDVINTRTNEVVRTETFQMTAEERIKRCGFDIGNKEQRQSRQWFWENLYEDFNADPGNFHRNHPYWVALGLAVIGGIVITQRGRAGGWIETAKTKKTEADAKKAKEKRLKKATTDHAAAKTAHDADPKVIALKNATDSVDAQSRLIQRSIQALPATDQRVIRLNITQDRFRQAQAELQQALQAPEEDKWYRDGNVTRAEKKVLKALDRVDAARAKIPSRSVIAGRNLKQEYDELQTRGTALETAQTNLNSDPIAAAKVTRFNAAETELTAARA